MSPEQCRAADWRRVGLRDGNDGWPRTRLDAYRRDCGEVGVRPDASAYLDGWKAGIPAFCTAERGWYRGLYGDDRAGYVCVGQPGEREFFHYQRAGLLIYRTQQALRDNEAEIDRLERRLHEAKDDDRRDHWRRQLRYQRHLRDALRNQMLDMQMLAP
nr:DUF2799 domain-containing protein [Pseudomonas sp. RIT-PI-AD]